MGTVDSDDVLGKLKKDRVILKVSKSTKDCGNVFEGSRIFFEYVVDKSKRQQFKDLKEMPFQVQISYEKKDGSKMMRVISQMKAVTLDKKAVRSQLDFGLLAQHGTHVTTELCAKGDYESSRMWTASNMNYMQRHAQHRGQALAMANYAQQNVALDHQMQQQILTEQQDEMMELEQRSAVSAPSGSLGLFAKGKGRRGKKSAKSKAKERKSKRNDVFSSHMYAMKKSS